MYHNKFAHLSTAEGNSCETITLCFITLFRLAFFDETGFDLLQSVINANSGGFAFLLFIYMIFTVIVLLNGLIGVFRKAFVVKEEVVKKKAVDPVYMSQLSYEINKLMERIRLSLRRFQKQTDMNEPALKHLRSKAIMDRLLVKGGAMSNQSTKKAGMLYLAPVEVGKQNTKLAIPVDKARDIVAERWYFVPFVILSSLLAVVECVIVAFPMPLVNPYVAPHTPSTGSSSVFEAEWTITFYLQIAILAASTILFPLGQYLVASQYDNAVVGLIATDLPRLFPQYQSVLKDFNIPGDHVDWNDELPVLGLDHAGKLIKEAFASGQEDPYLRKKKKIRRFLKKKLDNIEVDISFFTKLVEVSDTEVIMELIFLIFSWCTILTDPAVAVVSTEQKIKSRFIICLTSYLTFLHHIYSYVAFACSEFFGSSKYSRNQVLRSTEYFSPWSNISRKAVEFVSAIWRNCS